MDNTSVWKVGTRWGNLGHSVFDLFLDYGIVFVGGTEDGKKQGDYKAVKEGDLFLIADGATPIAIGVAQGSFQSLQSSGISVRARDQEYFDEETVVCKTGIRLIKDPQSWGFDCQKRFCRNYASESAVESYWQHLLAEDNSGIFDIQSRTVPLFQTNDGDAAVFHPHIRYRIPVYQRPYSWGPDEIDRLFQDILKGTKDEEVLFLGTMQLSAPAPLDVSGRMQRYDVIDGQQRISTFLLLFCLLEKMSDSRVLDTSVVLRTLVNKGEAQKDLDDFLSASLEKIQQAENSMNPYLRNACYVYEKLLGLTDNEDGTIFLARLRAFLVKNVRIVLIETKAGISKTIQIFNVINTTGLDLNGGDIFKVRFFEFLTDKRGAGDDVFDQISGLYGDIEKRNKKVGRTVTDMLEMLRILQSVLIAKYGLGDQLFDRETIRFFEELFDSLLGINVWPGFEKGKVEKIIQDHSIDSPLSIQGIQKLIACRYEYHFRFDSDVDGKFSDVAMTRLLMQSRYGWRYWINPVIYMYQRGESGLDEFYDELVRLCLCYSLIHGKVVNSAHACIRKALRSVFSGEGDTNNFMAETRRTLKDATRTAIHDFELAGAPVWKRIVCRLSEFLEYETPTDPAPILLKNLFGEPIDIEHIQAYNDQDESQREAIWKSWGCVLNGIGNLAMLESSLNRSISNRPFEEKKDGYKESRYKTIQALRHLPQWNIMECESRRERETDKLMSWLFSE